MNLPKSIPIGGRRVRIKICEREKWGEYFHDKAEIQISTQVTGKDLIETLRHEMLEASLYISGVAWNERHEQEAVVRCMETIFFPAWDNLNRKLNK